MELAKNGSNIGALGEGCDALNFSLTINEIMNNPSAVSDSDGEWFEIFNNGDVSYDLNGWTIKDGGSDSHVVSSALIINPGEHKVLSNNSNQNTNGGLVVDYQYDGITLANSDDELVLIDPNGTVFDSVAYDGGPEFPDLTGTSMGVIDAESDNNVGSNWQASTTAYGDGDLGTPGLPNFSSDIDVELTTIDFDTVLVGESFEQVLNIYNNGNTTLLLDSVYTSSDLFTLPFTESSIDDLLELTITFTPSAYGIVEDTLVIKTNDPDESHVEIPLIAFGYVPSPNIVLESTSIDFGTVMDGLTETIELHVVNDGDVSLSISSVYMEGSTAFTIQNFSASVAEEDTGSIDIQFSPDDETSFSGTLYIVSNDPDTDTLMVPLTGIGGEQTPIMVLSDDELYFGTVESGTTVEREIIIYNEGMLDLEIEEITITGSDYYTTTFSDAFVEPGDSVIVPFSFAPTEQAAEIIATATVASNVGTQTIELKAGYFGPVWHVSTTGSDETGDGSEENSFATIQYGIDKTPEYDSLFVHEGTYVENILLNKDIIVFGQNRETTIIDGGANGVVVLIAGSEDFIMIEIKTFTIKNGYNWNQEGGGIKAQNSVKISNIVVSENYSENGAGIYLSNGNPIINNVHIINNNAEDNGGGIQLQNCSPLFESVIIENNIATQEGGGILSRNSSSVFENVIIKNNKTNDFGGGACFFESSAEFYNSLILNNESSTGGISLYDGSSLIMLNSNVIGNVSTQDDEGGGVHLYDDSNVNITSTIIRNNFPFEINFKDDGNSISVDYSNVLGGESGIEVHEDYPNQEVVWGNNNIDSDPLFCEQSSGDFTIAENSPCIGSGENGTDIGALGVGCETAILSLGKELLPDNFVLHQNYPNPFNPTTEISYDIPEASVVSLSIYDLMGREIRTMINSEQTAGFKNIQWNATDNLGKSVPAGMYIYTIQAGEFRQTRKMVLLK